MTDFYPLRMQPIFKQYLWGGRRLATILNKPIGSEGPYAESWEVADHGEDQSRVADKRLAGQTVHQLLEGDRLGLLGSSVHADRFPLLYKFLDAQESLSVQVHPNDAQAARLNPPDAGKTEAWVVLDAVPGSRIYAGLRAGVTRHELERAIGQGIVPDCLHRFEPKVGDCVFIPAGTVHALGGGLLVAEIQQSSDTTFRLYDWDRVGADGKPRALHIAQALEVIDFQRGPVGPQQPQPLTPGRERLVESEYFLLDRLTPRLAAQRELLGGDRRCHILSILAGTVRLENDPVEQPLGKGDTVLLPASLGEVHATCSADSVLLDICAP